MPIGRFLRPDRVHGVMAALAALLVLLAGPRAAGAQMLVISEQNLHFGSLTPGTPALVAPTDITRSAQLRVQGRGRYQVTFQLPQYLEAPGGLRIPLVFGAADGRIEVRDKITTFNPATTAEFRINPAEQEARINIGGRALPPAGQGAGSYTATITMMIIQTGS